MPTHPFDEKTGWRTGHELPCPDLEEARRLLAPWLGNRRLVAIERLHGGLMNRNCRVRLEGTPASVVLRIYDRDDKEACAREVALLELLRSDVPVPGVYYAEPDRDRSRAPFAVLEFIEGISIRDLKRCGGRQEIGEAAYDAGRHLAALSTHRFARSGPLTPALTVESSFIDGPLTTAGLIEHFAGSSVFRQRVEAALVERLIDVARRWDEREGAVDGPSTLVHGDFNSRNILVRREGAEWVVAAILDWEFAFAGPALCDVGNFLRYERASRPRFEPSFSRGCRDGGLNLDKGWFRASRMADLPALCELLARDGVPSDVVTELIELVTATVEQRDFVRPD